MKTSTEIASIARIVGEERAIELVAKAGFDAWDFSMFAMCQWDWEKDRPTDTPHPLKGNEYLKFAGRLKRIGLDNGIVCNQSHAPFPVVKKEVRDCLKRAIECTAEAGGKICIIHPDNDKSPEENAEMYFELLPFAKEHGVKIAAENMWNWDRQTELPCFAACATPESFNAHLDAVHDEDFVACLDIGHAEMRSLNTSAVEMIHKLGRRLQALHIHDNDGKFDLHQIPFSMTIDFEKIARALKEIDYQGFFTLEADAFLNSYREDNVSEGVEKLAESVKKFDRIFTETTV